MGTNEYNKKAYDQRLIRFPKGTIATFHAMFGDEVAFNAWVTNLVCSKLLQHDVNFMDYDPTNKT